MNNTLRRAIWLALAAQASLPLSAWATNGYFAHGWGTQSKAMAGVATALPQDTLVAGTNPAGMAFVDDGLDLGVAFFSPSDRGYTANPDFARSIPGCPECFPPPFVTPGEYTSNRDWFLIPSFGYNRRLDAKQAIGISVFGNGGMNTKYTERPVWERFGAPPNLLAEPGPFPGTRVPVQPFPSFQTDFSQGVDPRNQNPFGSLTATTPTGVDLMQLFVELPYTYKITSGQSLGIAPVIAYQRFKAEGLEPFQAASTSPTNVTGNGYEGSWGAGVHVGWFGEITDQLNLGASYRSKVYMSKLSDYKGLFANDGEFDIPAMFNLGIAYKPKPNIVIAADYQRIFYDEVDALANSNNIDLTPCFGPGQPKPDFCLGGRSGLGFGWDSMDILKIGLRWDINPKWTVLAGFSWASDFIEGKQALFNVLAPATIKYHFTLGGTYNISDSDAINLSYAYMPKETIDGTSPNITASQSGDIFMEQQDIEISWTHRF